MSEVIEAIDKPELIIVSNIVIPGVGRLSTGDLVPDDVSDSQRDYLTTYGHARLLDEVIDQADSTPLLEDQPKSETDTGSDQSKKVPVKITKKRTAKMSPKKALEAAKQ